VSSGPAIYRDRLDTVVEREGLAFIRQLHVARGVGLAPGIRTTRRIDPYIGRVQVVDCGILESRLIWATTSAAA
jgi:hypothetical protein